MLTYEQIEEIAKPFTKDIGDYGHHEEGIREYDCEYFAKAIEKAVLDDVITLLDKEMLEHYAYKGCERRVLEFFKDKLVKQLKAGCAYYER